MALEASNWGVSLTFADRDKNTSTMKVYFQSGLAFAALEGAAAGLVAAAGALSDSPIVGYTISREFEETADVQPPEISDVERKGYFAFRLADKRLTSMSVPSIKNTLVLDNTNVINTADALVAAFVAAVSAGGTDSSGQDVIRLETAEKRHRGSRKG